MHPGLRTVEAPEVSPSEPIPSLESLKPEPHHRGRRWWLLVAAVIVAVVGFLYWQQRETARKQQARKAAGFVRTAVVRMGTLERTLRLTGTTAAEKFATIITPTLTGQRHYRSSDFTLILQKLVRSGSRVKKGDVLAEFDRQWMLNRLDDYLASVKQHELRLETLRVQLNVRRKASEQRIRAAKADLDKTTLDLRTIPVRSAITAELLRQSRGQADARYQQLLNEPKFLDISEIAAMRRSELDLQVERLEMKRAQRNVDKMVARAPMDGLAVMQRIYRHSEAYEIQAGDQVAAGLPFMQVVDLRSMVVNAVANQLDSQSLRVGLPAHVRFDAYPGLELPAKVYSVGAIAVGSGSRYGWVKNIPVRLKLEKLDPRVIPNFSVSADIVLEREPDTLLIPRECVFHDPENQEPFAYVQEPSGWEKRELELGTANNVAVAVHAGLREGEVVAAEQPAMP
jgi:HlyD family secretion protein